MNLKQAKDKMWKAIDKAEKNKDTSDYRYWEAYLHGLEEGQSIIDKIKECKCQANNKKEIKKAILKNGCYVGITPEIKKLGLDKNI